MIVTLTFYECEHLGDLDRYVIDIRKCLLVSGGEVSSYIVNEETECGTVRIEFENLDQKTKFMDLFKETESADFLN